MLPESFVGHWDLADGQQVVAFSDPRRGCRAVLLDPRDEDARRVADGVDPKPRCIRFDRPHTGKREHAVPRIILPSFDVTRGEIRERASAGRPANRGPPVRTGET